MIWRPPKRSDEIYHAWMKKGEKAEDHKYVVRIENGVTKFGTPKYKYFYSMAEYKAYKEGNIRNNNSSKKPGLLARAVDKITGQSYKDKMNQLEKEAKQSKEKAESQRESQKQYEKEGRSSQAEYERRHANESEDQYNKAINERIKTKREYENSTLAGKIDKTARKIEKVSKDVQKKIDKLFDAVKDTMTTDITLDDAKIGPTNKINSDYVIDKHNLDPNDQKYDNSFSDDDILQNMKKSGYYDYFAWIAEEEYGVGITTNEDMAEFLQSMSKEENDFGPGERLSDMAQRYGLVDETQPGMHPESFDDLNKLDKDIDDDIDMQVVNNDNLRANGDQDIDGDGLPDGYMQYGYSNNCAYCTLAYEMRQRGYDVEASAVSQETANTYDVIESWYEGGKFSQFSTTNTSSIEREILKNNPEGARGQFCMYWSTGGGHSVVYEVRGGEVYLRDCQTNQQYKLKDYPMAKYFNKSAPPIYMRTDNLKLSKKSLVGVKNR